MQTLLLKWPLYKSPTYSFSVTRTKSSRVLDSVLHVDSIAIIGLMRLLLIVQYRHIPMCNRMKYINKTKCALLHHALNLYQYIYTNIQEVHVCTKATLKGERSSIPSSSIGDGSDCESQAGEFKSHCGQEFFILYIFGFFALLTSRLSPYLWRQVCHSSHWPHFLNRWFRSTSKYLT